MSEEMENPYKMSFGRSKQKDLVMMKSQKSLRGAKFANSQLSLKPTPQGKGMFRGAAAIQSQALLKRENSQASDFNLRSKRNVI